MMDTHLDLAAALLDVPVFPLPEAVLFPGAVMPLHVFEPRYRAMLRDALASNKLIVIAMLEPADKEAPSPRDPARDPSLAEPPFAKVACVGLVTEHHRMADGRSNLLLRGVARVRLTEVPSGKAYRRARGVLLADIPSSVPVVETTALMSEATMFAGEVAKREGSFRFQLPKGLSPGELADLCAHHMVAEGAERQRVLETLDVRERVRDVTAAIAVQHHRLRKAERSTLN